jgi:hypothetical protein
VLLLLSPESSLLLILMMAEASSMAPPPHCHILQLLANFHIHWTSKNQIIENRTRLVLKVTYGKKLWEN